MNFRQIVVAKVGHFQVDKIFTTLFWTIHLLIALLIGNFYGLAPDEKGYLYTFQNLYESYTDSNPQFGSGWIAAPKIFLLIVYIPAKLMTFVGVPNYLAIRILSIALVFMSYYLLNSTFSSVHNSNKSRKAIFLAYLVPSICFWTSLGLRESFIILSLTLIFVGSKKVIDTNSKMGLSLLLIGSYSLICIKLYLWLIIVLAVLLSGFFLLVLKRSNRATYKIAFLVILMPVLLFSVGLPREGLNFILHLDLSSAGQRSGDSVSIISLGVGNSGNLETTYVEKTTPQTTPQTMEFHGNYTLVALHFYLTDHPDEYLSKLMYKFGVAKKLEKIWKIELEKNLATLKDSPKIMEKTSSDYILTPGTLSNPFGLAKSTLAFALGPWPWHSHLSMMGTIASFESPLWWFLYGFVAFIVIMSRTYKKFLDFPILFAFVSFIGLVIASGMTEVNLGTSFRHRSILLVPIIFIYLRTWELGEDTSSLGRSESKVSSG